MVKELMTSRRFAALFWTQFFTALNDNFAKNALVILIVFSIEGSGGGALATLAGVILMAPFFVLSALGGEPPIRRRSAVRPRNRNRVTTPPIVRATGPGTTTKRGDDNALPA